MKVPTYSKYGLKKIEVTSSEERDRKVTHLLTHRLPLIFGGVLGVVVFFVYFYNSGSETFPKVIYQFFLFGTIGIVCVGIPMVFFILAERVYYYYQKKKNSKYQSIMQYKDDRDNYDFWKIRKDEGFWRILDGLSIEKEIINIYMHRGYELLEEFETPEGEYDHVLIKDGDKIYLDCRTDRMVNDINYMDSLINNMKTSGAGKLILFSKLGFSSEVIDYAGSKLIELLTFKDIIKQIKDSGK